MLAKVRADSINSLGRICETRISSSRVTGSANIQRRGKNVESGTFHIPPAHGIGSHTPRTQDLTSLNSAVGVACFIAGGPFRPSNTAFQILKP